MMLSRLKVLFIMLFALLLLCSVSFAADEKPNVCKAKYEKQQDASLKQYMAMLPNQNVNLGRGKIAVKNLYVPNDKNYKYYTKFNKEDLLMAYDAFVVQPNGEVEIFSEFNGVCNSMGFMSGQFVSTFPAYLEDMVRKHVPDFKMPVLMYSLNDIDKSHKARYRRVNYVTSRLLSGQGRSSFTGERLKYELTYANLKGNLVFLRMRDKPQYYYTIGVGDVILASSPSGNTFKDYDVSGLPESIDGKKMVYLKLSCQKKDSKGRMETVYPWLWQNDYDSLAAVGSCTITRETPATLKGDKSAAGSRENKYDLSFSTPAKGISFLMVPFVDDEPNDRLYKLYTYGNEKGMEIEGASIKNDPSYFEVSVISSSYTAFDGLKVFSSGSRLNLGMTSYANYDRLLFSSNYYEKVDSEGMFFERGLDYGVRGSIGFYNLVPGTPNHGRIFMTQLSNRLKVYKSYTDASYKDCKNFATYTPESYKLRNFIASCYFMDSKLIILHDRHMFPSEYRFLSYGSLGEDYNVDFQYLRQTSASQVSESEMFRKVSGRSSQNVVIADHRGIKIIGLWPSQVFTQAEHYNPFKWVPGVMGSLKFSTKLFDSKAEAIRQLVCYSATGKCFLDGVQISSPRENLKCKSQSDCGPDTVCSNGLCVEKPAECKDYISGGNLDIHFYGISMTNDELKSYLDKSISKMLAVEPFASNRGKFTVKYNSIGHIELSKSMNTQADLSSMLGSIRSGHKDGTKCSGSPDFTVYVVPLTSSGGTGGFTNGNTLVINTKQFEGHEWYVLSHEFGHALGKSLFGSVVDEYTESGRRCDTGANCNRADTARSIWSRLGYADVKSIGGCGACEYEYGKNYIKPEGWSIMNNNPEEANSFNDITKAVLTIGLKRYS